MPDREKVIAALEKACRESVELPPFVGRIEITNEAIEKGILPLLREQEPAKPITQDAWPNPVKVCGRCGGYITYTAGRPRYCPNCGCEVKWDD